MNALLPQRTAQLDLGFVRRGDRTVLDRRLFSWPFVLTRTFLLDSAPAHMLTVIIQTSSSALHGEDRLQQRFGIGEGAAAHLTTQGAGVVHRAQPDGGAKEAVNIAVGKNAFLEYMPEPRILFPGSSLDQIIDIDCATTAIAIVSDAFTIHDPSGQGRSFGRLTSTMTLRLDGGDPVMVDRMDISQLSRNRWADHKAFGSIFLIAPLPAETLEQMVLDLSEGLAGVADLYAAASQLPGNAGIGVRLAARDLRSLRAGLEHAWIAFRTRLHGAPPASRRKGDDRRSAPL